MPTRKGISTSWLIGETPGGKTQHNRTWMWETGEFTAWIAGPECREAANEPHARNEDKCHPELRTYNNRSIKMPISCLYHG